MGASAHPRIRPGGTRWRRRLKDLLCIPQAWVQMGAWHCCDNSAGLSPAGWPGKSWGACLLRGPMALYLSDTVL